MLFHASKVLKDRRGDPVREPNKGEKPKKDERTGENLGFDEAQLRDILHGDIAMVALDSSLHGDDEAMKKSTTEWLRLVMRREKISSAISEALTSGDGWVELDTTQCDLLKDRLAIYVAHSNLRGIGPVLEALDNPPKERPSRKVAKASKSNGKTVDAVQSEEAAAHG